MSDVSKYPVWQVSRQQRTRARSLRRDLTDAERTIWNTVRARRVCNLHFRRQVPIGPFIVDFVCYDIGLVIEIDGGQHFNADGERRDARRDEFLASNGYRVLRFNNHDVLSNRRGVLEIIVSTVETALSPPLPRERGREQTESAAR